MTDVVKKIAATLKETKSTPLAEIERVVTILGEERALTLLEETLKVEAEGGMPTDDGKRRRSLGGIYFKLVKDQTIPKERGKIFGPSSYVPFKAIAWEDSAQLSTTILKLPKGEAETVKISIVGRPGRVIEKESVVITSMQNSAPPNLPKGMPKLPADPTTYIVYIGRKHWLKVKESLDNNADEQLIIDGYPMFDKRIGKTGAMTVYALSVKTKRSASKQ